MPTRARISPGIALLLALAGPFGGCASYEGARLYQRGTAALDAGDSGRAIADLERAAEIVPNASEVQNHLGLAYAAAGRREEALEAFRHAVALDCENRAAVENLRRAERRSGESEP